MSHHTTRPLDPLISAVHGVHGSFPAMAAAHPDPRHWSRQAAWSAETGGALEPLGRFYALPSETNRWVSLFLARPVERRGTPKWDNVIEKYFDMSVVEMPFGEALAHVGKEIEGIETAGALLLAQKHLASRAD